MKIEFPGKKKRLSYPGSQNFPDAVDEAFADQANVAVFSIKKGQGPGQIDPIQLIEFNIPGPLADGCTFGGNECAAHAFRGRYGVKVLACDPYLPDAVKAQFEDVEFVDFDTLVRESDILSIHVGLNKETFHKFNHETFRQMKNNALIINTARGPIIDQKALAEALISGEIRGAGLEHGRK